MREKYGALRDDPAHESPPFAATSLDITAGDSDVSAFVDSLEEVGYYFGWMLKIGIDNADDIIASVLEAVDDCGSEAALVGADDDSNGVLGRQRCRGVGGAVATIVVDKEYLVFAASE